MSLPTYVVGVDPGPQPGIAALSYTNGRLGNAQVLQVSAGLAVPVVGWLLEGARPVERLVLAIERFVVGPRAGRSSNPRAGQVTRDMVGALAAVGELHGAQVVLRPAVEVKRWATDERLAAAHLLKHTKGMPHARDGCRHALFAAVRDCGLPDPLSRHSRSPR